MTRGYAEWLDEYLLDQQKNHPEVVLKLFSEDAEYSYGPYYASRFGIQQIYDHHRNALAHQRELRYEYRILAETEEYALAWFSLELKELLPDEPCSYEGVFQIFLGLDGKCWLFKEWYNFR